MHRNINLNRLRQVSFSCRVPAYRALSVLTVFIPERYLLCSQVYLKNKIQIHRVFTHSQRLFLAYSAMWDSVTKSLLISRHLTFDSHLATTVISRTLVPIV